MKIGFVSVLFFSLFSARVDAQILTPPPEAPEKWSKPEVISAIKVGISPSVTADGKTMYFRGYGIEVTFLTDTGWCEPTRLNDATVNSNELAEKPVISPNGKRLFFSWFLGDWVLFYSDWDSLSNDWGTPHLGPSVYDFDYEAYMPGHSPACMLDDTTLIFFRSTSTYIAHWSPQTQTWDSAAPFPGPLYGESFYADHGAAITPDRNKAYLGYAAYNDSSGRLVYNVNVFYRKGSSYSVYAYGSPYTLNFCFEADSGFKSGTFKSNWEGCPSITVDGRELFFSTNYDGTYRIYETHMVVDQNGDSVTSLCSDHPSSIPEGFRLYDVYPNPANPTVTIAYSLPYRSSVSLFVYDILGRRLKELSSGIGNAGEHRLFFDGSGLASGVYIVVLETPLGPLAKKIVLVK